MIKVPSEKIRDIVADLFIGANCRVQEEVFDAWMKAFQEEEENSQAREVIKAQETKQPAVAPSCPKCGQAMTYKGQKPVAPRTWVGEVAIERGYYHCAGCKEGLFPPG